jgi:hypothetical protein
MATLIIPVSEQPYLLILPTGYDSLHIGGVPIEPSSATDLAAMLFANPFLPPPRFPFAQVIDRAEVKLVVPDTLAQVIVKNLATGHGRIVLAPVDTVIDTHDQVHITDPLQSLTLTTYYGTFYII